MTSDHHLPEISQNPFPNLLLGVNIDHCATLRQARYRNHDQTSGGIVEPDPVALAQLAVIAGADSITVHPREDARHIQRDDVRRLRQFLQVPLNLEMAATGSMLAFALEIRPAFVCLVPENREEVTTEGGLDVAGQVERLKPIVQTLQNAGCIVSLFIDPDPQHIEAAKLTGAPCVELHTGSFAEAFHQPPDQQKQLQRLCHAAQSAHDLRLTVNAGHGINYQNIRHILRIPWLHELNIGHSILSRALFTGISQAVQNMRQAMSRHH